MTDPFLEVTKAKTDDDAIHNAIQAALGHNQTYKDSCVGAQQAAFRDKLRRQVRIEARRYSLPESVSDAQHCDAIQRIADEVSKVFRECLVDGRLRYGTAQKAFNLYLKFLWRMGRIKPPPHCPVDRVVLSEAKIKDRLTGGTPSWTRCKTEDEYRTWIRDLKAVAARRGLGLAEWEQEVWLADYMSKQKQNAGKNSFGHMHGMN